MALGRFKTKIVDYFRVRQCYTVLPYFTRGCPNAPELFHESSAPPWPTGHGGGGTLHLVPVNDCPGIRRVISREQEGILLRFRITDIFFAHNPMHVSTICCHLLEISSGCDSEICIRQRIPVIITTSRVSHGWLNLINVWFLSAFAKLDHECRRRERSKLTFRLK